MFQEIFKSFLPYLPEIITVGALVEIFKGQWAIKFLCKNLRWWANRLLPLLIGIIICCVWRLENFSWKEYLKAILICWAFSGLIYNFLKNKLKRKRNEEENNNY